MLRRTSYYIQTTRVCTAHPPINVLSQSFSWTTRKEKKKKVTRTYTWHFTFCYHKAIHASTAHYPNPNLSTQPLPNHGYNSTAVYIHAPLFFFRTEKKGKYHPPTNKQTTHTQNTPDTYTRSTTRAPIYPYRWNGGLLLLPGARYSSSTNRELAHHDRKEYCYGTKIKKKKEPHLERERKKVLNHRIYDTLKN